jgi:hypothetical protein
LAPKIVLPLALLTGAIFATDPVKADLTYHLQSYPTDQTDYTDSTIRHTLTGAITTDGYIGDLNGHILSWNYSIDGGTTHSSTDPNAATVIDTSQFIATPTQITLGQSTLPGPGDVRLYGDHTIGGLTFLDWKRETNFPVYSAVVQNQTIWFNSNPTMGGTDPWVIATTASPVPEPSTAIVAVCGTVAFIAYGWSRHRRAQRRQAAT